MLDLDKLHQADILIIGDEHYWVFCDDEFGYQLNIIGSEDEGICFAGVAELEQYITAISCDVQYIKTVVL